jgi:hypothetical protein
LEIAWIVVRPKGAEFKLRIVCKPICIASFAPEGEVSVDVSEEIAAHLDGLHLNIQSDYYTSFNRPDSVAYKVSAEEYLFGNDEKWRDKSLLCPEMPALNHVTSAIRLLVPSEGSWSKQAVALIHAGRTGCIAPVHFDWDHTWVAHACLVGRKSFFIFPPQAGWLLNPIINTSALLIPRFSEADRHNLLNLLGGTEVILEAGQGILLPSLFWHGVLYEKASLSISVRFEQWPGGRPFAVLPRSWLLQRLVWFFFQEGYGRDAEEFLIQYLKSFFKRTKTWKTRYSAITQLCRKALLERGEQQGVLEHTSESFSSELALASQELKLYYDNLNATLSYERNRVQEIREYLFRSIRRPFAQDLRLSRYALSARQGLPPKRGLVQIEQE